MPAIPPAPRAIPAEAIDALLRAVHADQDALLWLRDEAILALLVYAGLRVQAACDVQIRDLDSTSSRSDYLSARPILPRCSGCWGIAGFRPRASI